MFFRIRKASKPIFFCVLFAFATATTINAQEKKPAGKVIADQLGYERCFALIIGLNYENSIVSETPPLENAINDAIALRDVLEKHYGFECTLLTDDPNSQENAGLANKENIQTRFEELEDKIKEGDSFLLFFAGHGLRRNGKTYVVPDVSGIKTARDLRRAELLNTTELVHPTDAKHNLLIFDTCYSGSVSKLFDKFKNGNRIQDRSFSFRSFQLITSSAAYQEARDGARKEHSPFAIELLENLKNPKNGIVRAKQDLFENIEECFEADRNRGQTPQYDESNLSKSHVGGEYHFVLKSKIPKLESRTAFQMMPGRPGKWWFTETPWLSPQIRYELDRNSDLAQYSDPSDPESIEKLRNVVSSLDSKIPISSEFVSQALDWESLTKKERESAIQKILKRHVVHFRGESLATAQRKHYRANLLHFQNQTAKANANENGSEIYDAYEAASKAYGDENIGSRIRCRVDQSIWLLNTRTVPFATRRENFLRAIEILKESQKLIDQELDGVAPVETKVEILCQWSGILRKLASSSEDRDFADQMYEASEKKLDEAINVVVGSNQLSTNNLRAYVYERLAWTLMDQWKTTPAKRYFSDSLALWENVLAEDPDAKHKSMHARHGLATVDRLEGAPVSAIKAYSEIDKQLRELLWQKKGDIELTKRLANTLERLADAHLFSGDPAGAFSNYERVKQTIKTSRTTTDWEEDFQERIDTKYVVSAAIASSKGRSLGEGGRNHVDSIVTNYLKDSLGLQKPPPQLQMLERVFETNDSSIYLKMMSACWLSRQPAHAEVAVNKLRSLVQEKMGSVNKRDEKELLLLVAEYIGQEQQEIDIELFESVAASGGAASIKYLRKSNELSILTRARLTQTKSSFDILDQKVHSAKGNAGNKLALTDQDPYINFFFVHSKNKLLLLSYNPKNESRSWMIADFDLTKNELNGDLEEDTVRAVERKLAQMEVPPRSKVFWSDDFLKLAKDEYPFSIPVDPELAKSSSPDS